VTIAHENIAQAADIRFVATTSATAINTLANITTIADYTLKGNEVLKYVGGGLQILEGTLVKQTIDLAAGATVFFIIPITEGGLLLKAVSEGDLSCSLYRLAKLSVYFYSFPIYLAVDALEKVKDAHDFYQTIVSLHQTLKDHLNDFPKEAKCVLY
jgi:hypothetical protein